MAKQDFTIIPSITHASIERYWSSVALCTHGPQCHQCCWLWQGSIRPNGYGVFVVNHRKYAAHRFSYILTYGSIFPGFFVCHLCDIKKCVNPFHLCVGTPGDNLRDAIRKGMVPFPIREKWQNHYAEQLASILHGEQLPQTKLTAAQVVDIRHLFQKGRSKKSLAACFGISRQTINDILWHRTWKHVPEE